MIPLMKNAFIEEYETKQKLAEFILRTDKFSMGEKCFEFESSFAKFLQRSDAVLFNSGGSANLAMMQVLKNLGKLKDGSKIGFSSLTWATNVMPIIQMQMVPVAIDSDKNTINVMTANIVKALETEKLDALFLTNVLGFCGDLPEIKELCQERNILLIEDNCESLGSKIGDILTGNFGEMSSFSFFIAHHMSTIEGGMVVTDDVELAKMLRIVRANGWDRNLSAADQLKIRKENNVSSEFRAKYSFYDLGFNFRPTEITGFLGCEQLKYLQANIDSRNDTFLKLAKVAKANADLIAINCEHMSFVSNFSYPVICKTKDLRDKYVSYFTAAGVEIRPLISGNIQNQPFFGKYVKNRQATPNVDLLDQTGFYFGNYPDLTETDLEVLSSCLMDC